MGLVGDADIPTHWELTQPGAHPPMMRVERGQVPVLGSGQVPDITGLEPLGKSDHVVVTLKYQYSVDHRRHPSTEGKKQRNFKRGDYGRISEEIAKENWDLLDTLDVEKAWDKIKVVIKSSIEDHIPLQRLKKGHRPSAAWWSAQLLKQVKLKHSAWKDYRRTKSKDDYQKYVFQRNRTSRIIRDARCKYESTIAQKSKQEPKELFKYIRSQQKIKPGVGYLENEEGNLTENDHDKAEILNKHFHGVFVNEGNEELPEFPDRVEDECVLDSMQITPAQVQKELTSLDSSKAAGPDDIPAIVLKKCAEQLATPLALLYQKTLATGRLPRDWKHAKVVPIFKKGSQKKPCNYRPVSLTSQACKVLERIIRRKITNHLETYGLISKHQHGFMRRKSCQTNLLEALEDWTRSIDKGNSLDIAYLDFQKAFDMVPHRRLERKLSAYGIRGQILNWICDFLRDQSQQVLVGSSHSSEQSISSGVPQGSVLGPTLFILYVNELPSLVRSNMLLFADDSKLYRTIEDDRDAQILQDDLHTLEDWCSK